VEGRIHFHSARSTAFPQPAPGTAPAPGPLKVPPEQLRSMLGITDAMLVTGRDRIALIDSPLSA
jgi:3',5'-cyclic-AMP phosphodiesterase